MHHHKFRNADTQQSTIMNLLYDHLLKHLGIYGRKLILVPINLRFFRRSSRIVFDLLSASWLLFTKTEVTVLATSRRFIWNG